MLRNISNTFFTRFLSSFINLAVSIIISNYLGAEGRGEQGLVLTTITMVTLFSAIIGAGSITYLSPRLPLKMLLIPSYLWGLLLSVLLIFLIPFQTFFSFSVVAHIAILSFILNGTQIHSSILLGKEKVVQTNNIQLVSTIIFLLCIFLFFVVLKYKEIQFYIYSLYFSYVISYIYSIFLIFKLHGNSTQNLPSQTFLYSVKNLTHYGFLNQLDVIVQMASFRISYYLIDIQLGKGEVGVYSNAVSIIEAIWMISRSISMVQFARIVNSTDIDYSRNLTIKLLKISSLLVFMASLLLLIIPSEFYTFLFGKDFWAVKKIILTFIPGVLVFNASFVLSGFFSGVGKYGYNVIASSIGLIVTILLLIVLIPEMGVVGAGITASLSYMTVVLIKTFFFIKNYKVAFNELFIKREDYTLIKSFFSKENFKKDRQTE
jgi:O-antigen/teichoic acid export membrane protein